MLGYLVRFVRKRQNKDPRNSNQKIQSQNTGPYLCQAQQSMQSFQRPTWHGKNQELVNKDLDGARGKMQSV
jgi:hypothetical protein